MPIVFGLVGAAVGASQAALLARTARGGVHPLWFFLRFALVAAVLLVAARSGAVLPAAAGWAVGFVISAVTAYWRLR
jgi:hypothetical protein